MKRRIYKALSCLLACVLMLGLLPQAAYAAQDTLTVRNGTVEVTVSAKNGGFAIRTLEGDVLTKDDNNKNLLFRRDAFDTSFTSFQVSIDGGAPKEYIFGNNYSFLGLGSSGLTVSEVAGGIEAGWTVGNLTFIQRLEPVFNEASNEHGTVAISYRMVNNTGKSVTARVRVLLDTALGEQDYAYYELANEYEGGYRRIEREQVVYDTQYIPANFFAYDNYENPTMAAYTVKDLSPEAIRPYQLAFAHWNNLAATVFDFVPDGDLTFTNPNNKKYLTADSAAALYYDLGSVAPGAEGKLSFYYGVDSHVKIKDTDRVGISITAPTGLTLSPDKTHYTDAQGNPTGKFEITTNVVNINKPGATPLQNIALAVVVDDDVIPLDSFGNEFPEPPTNKYPANIAIDGLGVGQTKQLVWKLRADVGSETTYRKIVFRAYDMTSSNGLMLLENIIGSATAYVLCPGGDGALPSVLFTGADPKILYNKGTRHFYVTGKGFGLLNVEGNYTLKAVLKADPATFFTIPRENIVFAEPGVLDIVLKEEMPTGEYELVFEWQSPPAGVPKELTAPALSFIVTGDPAYKNDIYGLAVVLKEGSGGTARYKIKTFATEDAFAAFEEETEADILLIFRGEFTVNNGDGDEVTDCTAVSTGSRDTVTLNGALDFEGGNVHIYRTLKNDGVAVEFDGKLYTTGSRTPIWSGNAGLTTMKDGVDFGLVAYNARGEQLAGAYQPNSSISLAWPGELNMLQTIAGFAIEFRYAELGAMYSDLKAENRTGYVVSFGGKLDLSFLMPGGVKQAEAAERAEYDKVANAMKNGTRVDITTVPHSNGQGFSPSAEARKEDEKNKTTPKGKINIYDILYGNNKGYLGVNTEVELMLPKYVEPLPALGGTLSVNTIGGYKIGVAGKAKTAAFEMEFELRVVSAPNGAPVPDKLYFYIDGFEPGINIDTFGVVWLTGGGGGIDKLYNTIFSSGGLPPLTILLSAKLDILKVVETRADLSLSLRGFSLKVSDVKLKKTDITVMKGAQLGINWYPEFTARFAATVDLYSIIRGSAYIVVNPDSWEFFIKAGLIVPEFIPLVGGMEVASASLGANKEKIWGAVKLLGLRLGVTYYWGGDFDFGSGGEVSEPTYPELFSGFAVGRSEETGRVLYMKAGTNIDRLASAQTVSGTLASGFGTLAAAPTLRSNLAKTAHLLNLGGAADDMLLTVTFTGDNKPKTLAEARAALTVQKPDGGAYPLVFFEPTLANAETANANFVYDADNDMSGVTLSITEPLAGDWKITTTGSADLTLYGVAALPQADSLTAGVSGGTLTASWTGSGLDLTDKSFYLCQSTRDDDMGVLLGTSDNKGQNGGSASFALPDDLPSGTYYLRMVNAQEGVLSETLLAASGGTAFSFVHVNTFQPAAPQGVTVKNAGDGRLEILPQNIPADADGVVISLYEDTPEGLLTTDYMGMAFANDPTGRILTGGRFVTTDGQAYGLVSGKKYVAGVSSYRNKLVDGEVVATVQSPEVFSAAETLREVTPPVMVFAADPALYKTLPRVMNGSEGETTVAVDTFTANDVAFTLHADVPVSGEWSIDGALAQNLIADENSTALHTVTGVTQIPVSATLPDGDHMLTFMGQDADGDSVHYTKYFAVDTTPPRLLLSSPVAGSLFSEDGSLTVEGVGDEDALYTVTVDGVTLIDRKMVSNIPGGRYEDGLFSFPLNVGEGFALHRVRISAEDAAGNATLAVADVKNRGLSSIVSLGILQNGQPPAGGNLALETGAEIRAALQLVAVTESGRQMLLNDEKLVTWRVTPVRGSATVEPDGSFAAEPGSLGYVQGLLRVAENASLEGNITFGAETFSGGVQLDLTALNAAIALAREKLAQGIYTDQTTDALQNALDGALAVAGNPAATQAEADAATAALNTAIAALKTKATYLTLKCGALVPVKKGRTFQILVDTNADPANITYVSVNPARATVSKTGLVTAIVTGAVMILVGTNDGSGITRSVMISVTN